MRITVNNLMEKFNITESQAKYIIEEAKGLKVSIENIDIRSTGTANSESEQIEEVMFDSNKHIWYI